jgi:hypothetical protein
MLKAQRPYHDFGVDYYEQQYRAIALCNLNRKATKLGFRLEPFILSSALEVFWESLIILLLTFTNM